MTGRFATLGFERRVAAPPHVLWQVWTAPAARAIWAAPSPAVTVDFLESDPRVGGREVSICRVDGAPDIRCDGGWLELDDGRRAVSYEVVSCAGQTRSCALVTAEIGEGAGDAGSSLRVTVQLSASDTGMEAGYRKGFGAGLDNLAAVADRSMVLRRRIAAPRALVWAAWTDPAHLPRWWGPDGYSCRTDRIDLRAGGEWLFDMIGPDGTIYPNHHRYHDVRPEERIVYSLHWGEDGPKHADAWVGFEERGVETEVTLGMVFGTAEEFRAARGFGAEALGLQTLGKLARHLGAA